METFQFFKLIHRLPSYIVKVFLLISLFSCSSFDINSFYNNNNNIVKYSSNKFGIKLANAWYANTYFDFNYYDRILNVADFGYEKNGSIYIKLNDVVLQYQGRRFRTFSNYTFFSDLYIGVCETQKWLDFIKENDNNNNNPYYSNITVSDDDQSSNSNKNNNKTYKKRTIEEMIIDNIKEIENINYDDITEIKPISNFTNSFNPLNSNENIVKTKIQDFLIPLFSNEPYDDLNTLNFDEEDDLIENDSRSLNETESKNDDDNSSDINYNYIIVDRFLDLLQESNICANLTDLYSLASDLESYIFRMEIPKDGQYTMFMLKTKGLISMGFDGEITISLKNPYKYPHFSTDQYNIIKEHSLLLGIWMIIFLLWICTWINKIKLEIPLAKIMTLFPLLNIITLGLETYKYHYYGINGDHSVLVVLFLAILLMARTTAIYIGMLYFSKGIYVIRIMMIPDETRSILAVTLFTALTDAVFVGLGEGSAISMVVYRILLYSYMFKNYLHHLYVLWKYLRQIKKDYSKETTKTYKPDDPITKTTYEEIYKLMQPNVCKTPDGISVSNNIRMSSNQPPVPVRSTSLDTSHNYNNNGDISNIQIPNKTFNNPLSTENQKVLSPNTQVNPNLNKNQWRSSNVSSTQPSPKSPTMPNNTPSNAPSNGKQNDKKQNIDSDDDEDLLKRKIISIEETSVLYSKILIESYNNKFIMLLQLFFVSIALAIVDLIFRIVYLPYYYDDNMMFYLIYEGFFIISFIVYGIVLYPRSPKNYIWIPKWVIQNTTQSISDNENEYMD